MTDNEIFENNLTHFQVVKKYQDRAQCKCPAHQDKQASLTVTKGRKCTLLYCHAGCQLDDILNAAGLEKRDIFYESTQNTANWRAFIEKRENNRIEAVYNYVSCNGQYAFTKVRLQGKHIIYGRLENERFTYGLSRNKPRKSYRAVYGNLSDIKKAINDNKPVFIVEGEKDVNTLTKHGYTSFTYGGVNDWQSDFAELVNGAMVIILADNDKPGIDVANRIYEDVVLVAKSVKIMVPMPDIPKADITDYFESGKTNADFEKLINNAVTSNRIEGKKAPKKTLESTLKEIHAENYETSDKGNARLFADIFKDKHRYCSTRKDFMLFDGKRWIDDLEGLSARKSAKELSDALIRYAVTVDTDGKYLKAVTPLCNLRNRNNMLQDSRDLSYFTNEQLDVNDYILNVQNGTLDLSGDKPIPKFKLVINTNYLPVITDDTIFSSGRLNVVSFDRHFEPHEQDKHLKDKLRKKEELSGILNWCLEGLRLYRKDGLKAPAAVQKATNAYRADSDKIGNFINECLKKTDTNSKAKEIYDCYVKWCADNGYGIENKGNFFAEMKNKGLFATSGTVTGKTVKNVIKGYVIDTDFQTVNDDSEIPFC